MNKLNRTLSKIKQIPVYLWIIIVTAFIIGYIIRGANNHSEHISDELHQSTEKTGQIWTCSMHPQIRMTEPGKCPICFMDLIPLNTDININTPTQLPMSADALKLAEIQTTRVRRAPAHTDIYLSGKIVYDETRQKTISAWIPGRLERLFVDYTGTSVKKGEHLAEIYSPELYSAQEELIQARKAVDALSDQQLSSKNNARMTLQASRQKLRLAGLTIGQIEAIEKRPKPLEKITIFSPLSGVITEKYAHQGDYVQTGSKIYTVTDLSRVWVILDAYESDLFWLRYAQTVTFNVEAFPGELFKGRIAFISPTLNPVTRTVSVRVNIPNPDGRLKPGMFVSGKITADLDKKGHSINPQLAGKYICPMHPEIVKDQPADCDICGMPLVKAETLGIVHQTAESQLPLLVPATSVLKTGKRAIVYVKIPNTKEPAFEIREVQLGARAGDSFIVLSGVNEGEEVVTNGNFKIDSAMQLASKPSMMNPSLATNPDMRTESNQSKSHIQEAVTFQNIPAKFRNDLSSLFNEYLDAQSSLAQDESHQSKNHLRKLGELISSFDITQYQLSADAKIQFSLIKDRITRQTGQSDHWQSIEDNRKAFEEISMAVLELEKNFGHSGDLTFYESYCPMAFNNKGAYWLAKEKQINNPFFGSKMLRCGEVKASYPSVSEVKENNSHD